MPLNKNVFAAKFVVRIAPFGGVAVRLNAKMIFENGGIAAESVINLFLSPNVKRTFSVIGFTGFDQAVSILRRKKTALL